MTHVAHGLVEEFPEFKQKIHDLKMADVMFSRMADEYHTLNKAVHRAEAGLDPVDDARLAGMLKERVHLKDKIFARLTQSN
ncbi:MAG: DUF465 domain-containing protein [Pseudomonadota bacterium]